MTKPETQEAAPFRFSPAGIASLLEQELGADRNRVTKEKAYPEMFSLRSRNKDGIGNIFHIVTRGGEVQTLPEGTQVRSLGAKLEDAALVVEYYSRKGNTFKIYMPKDMAEVRAASNVKAAAALDDDEE